MSILWDFQLYILIIIMQHPTFIDGYRPIIFLLCFQTQDPESSFPLFPSNHHTVIWSAHLCMINVVFQASILIVCLSSRSLVTQPAQFRFCFNIFSAAQPLVFFPFGQCYSLNGHLVEWYYALFLFYVLMFIQRNLANARHSFFYISCPLPNKVIMLQPPKGVVESYQCKFLLYLLCITQQGNNASTAKRCR